MSPSDRSENLRIACAVEGEQHVRHCAAMLHSLLSTQPESLVHIDYLHGSDTSARGRKRLAKMVTHMGGSIGFHEVPDTWVAGLPIKGFLGKATWYRIFLNRVLEDADRAIYLDVDLLVRDSLRPLWETDLGGCLIGAVTNVPPGLDGRERLDLGDDAYFNAGVLLLDLAAMRSQNTDEHLRQFAVANAPRLLIKDQDALNSVLHDRRLALHPRWNVMNSIQSWDHATEYFTEVEVAEARANPAIRHFEGPSFNKPWHLLADRDSQRQYILHRRETPWPHVRRTGCTPLNALRYAKRRLL